MANSDPADDQTPIGDNSQVLRNMAETLEERLASINSTVISAQAAALANPITSAAAKITADLEARMAALAIPKGSPFEKLFSENRTISLLGRTSVGSAIGDLMKIDPSIAALQSKFSDLMPIRRAEELHVPELPHFPPNPIYKTNDLLEDMNTDISDMRNLAAETAKIQAQQAEIITGMMVLFDRQVIESNKAGKINLAIALFGILLAIVAIVIPLYQTMMVNA